MSWNNEGFVKFFDGDFSGAKAAVEDFSNRRWLTADRKPTVIGEDGFLTPHGVEDLCYNFPLNKKFASILVRAGDGKFNDEDFNEFDILRRCFLLDEKNKLTTHGYFKMISTLPLKEQVKLLELPFYENQFDKQAGQSTEGYIVEKYKSNGYQCVHDEGGSLFSLISIALRSEVELLRSIAIPSVWYDPTHHFADVSITKLQCYTSEDANGTKFVDDDRMTILLGVIERTTRQRLIDGFHLELAAVKRYERDSLLSRFGLDFFLDLFDSLELQRFIDWAKFALTNHDCCHGLPDLLAFKEQEIQLIEVKRNDKIMFHQARTLNRLSTMLKPTITHVAIERVVLK